jgi:hypothetical protein
VGGNLHPQAVLAKLKDLDFLSVTGMARQLPLPASRRISMPRFLNAALLAAALMTPLALLPTSLRADDRTYHDKAHDDEHHWDSHEDRAYRVYVKENHRKYRQFSTMPENDQEAYWAWRHEHSDAVLKINVR